jgi:TetR/AcrR family transcriptional regulator, transcriptional repressor for nem operon
VIDQLQTTDPTRERIRQAAMQLFAAKGFQSTSIADILQLANAHSGSLYHFYPTKQDLLLAVLEAYRTGIEPMLLQPAWSGVEDPIERVFALLGVYRQALQASGCTYGCPIGSLALELHEPDPPVRELLSLNFDGWVKHVASCLDAARTRLPHGADVRKLASLVLCVMEGGVMQARTHRSLASFDAGVEALRDYFHRLQQDARREQR